MKMSNYIDHAMREFRAAKWLDENGKYCDEMQEAICNHILKLLEVFGDEGHSGSSAPYAINVFEKLANFKPIVPLTGEDWEWVDVSRGGKPPHYQNIRCSHVFKDTDGKAYDINGKVFWEWYTDEETGEKRMSYYTCGESRVYIKFPYIPHSEHVYRESGAEK
jgi:hypothetical protein